MQKIERLKAAVRYSRLARLTCTAAFITCLAVPSPIRAQDPGGSGARRGQYIAVTSLRDYFGDHRGASHRDDNYFTRTILVAVNGTVADANVATYVLGDGQVFRHEFALVGRGDEVRLLTIGAFGGDSNSLCSPPSRPRQCPDPEIPPYVGETIVIASDAPVIVLGAVFREFRDFLVFEDENEVVHLASPESRRTLDVRQFDCNDLADFQKVSLFCQTFRPVPSPRTP